MHTPWEGIRTYSNIAVFLEKRYESKTILLNADVGNSINVGVTGKRKRERNWNKVYFLIVFSVLSKFYEKRNSARFV